MSRRKFLCLDCRVDTGKIYEHYMLVDTTWLRVVDSAVGMLCVGCIEIRLGRKLTAADFNDSYLNKSKKFIRSARLLERMRS